MSSDSDNDTTQESSLYKRSSRGRSTGDIDLTAFSSSILSGLEPVNSSDFILHSEELKPENADEIWIIQCPANVSLTSVLQKKKLNLDGKPQILFSNDDDDKSYEVSCIGGTSEESGTALLPNESSGKMEIVSFDISGHIIIKEAIEDTLPVLPVLSPRKVQRLESGIKARHPIYGVNYEDQVKSMLCIPDIKLMKKKHKKDNANTTNSVFAFESIVEPANKMKQVTSISQFREQESHKQPDERLKKNYKNVTAKPSPFNIEEDSTIQKMKKNKSKLREAATSDSDSSYVKSNKKSKHHLTAPREPEKLPNPKSDNSFINSKKSKYALTAPSEPEMLPKPKFNNSYIESKKRKHRLTSPIQQEESSDFEFNKSSKKSKKGKQKLATPCEPEESSGPEFNYSHTKSMKSKRTLSVTSLPEKYQDHEENSLPKGKKSNHHISISSEPAEPLDTNGYNSHTKPKKRKHRLITPEPEQLDDTESSNLYVEPKKKKHRFTPLIERENTSTPEFNKSDRPLKERKHRVTTPLEREKSPSPEFNDTFKKPKKRKDKFTTSSEPDEFPNPVKHRVKIEVETDSESGTGNKGAKRMKSGVIHKTDKLDTLLPSSKNKRKSAY